MQRIHAAAHAGGERLGLSQTRPKAKPKAKAEPSAKPKAKAEPQPPHKTEPQPPTSAQAQQQPKPQTSSMGRRATRIVLGGAAAAQAAASAAAAAAGGLAKKIARRKSTDTNGTESQSDLDAFSGSHRPEAVQRSGTRDTLSSIVRKGRQLVRKLTEKRLGGKSKSTLALQETDPGDDDNDAAGDSDNEIQVVDVESKTASSLHNSSVAPAVTVNRNNPQVATPKQPPKARAGPPMRAFESDGKRPRSPKPPPPKTEQSWTLVQPMQSDNSQGSTAQPTMQRVPSGARSGQAVTRVRSGRGGDKKAELNKDYFSCWHESKIDVIIDFQLYELLQRKWRYMAPDLINDRQESEAEIVADMIHNRSLVQEEREGDARHTIGFKTKLIQRILAKVHDNLEQCLLVEQEFSAFLEITLGDGNVAFDSKEHLEFIKHHPELSKDFRALQKPSTENSDDDLLFELRKPGLPENQVEQYREVFRQLDREKVGAVDMLELQEDPNYGIADFDCHAFGPSPKLRFDDFLALVCPSQFRTDGTVWDIIIRKIRSRIHELQNACIRPCFAAEALASLEDELLPTLPPQTRQQYMDVYAPLFGCNAKTSDTSVRVRSAIRYLFDEMGAPGQDYSLEESGRLTFDEFTGFIRVDSYKRQGAKTTTRRVGLTALEVQEATSMVQKIGHDDPRHHVRAQFDSGNVATRRR